MRRLVAVLVASATMFLVGCGSGDLATASDVFDYQLGTIVDLPEDLVSGQKDFSRIKAMEADLDITSLSATLAFGQVAQIMQSSSDYIGKTIKVGGIYYSQTIQELDVTMHLVMLVDDTNCCQGYLEFILPEGSVYPEFGEEIMLIGTYQRAEDITGVYSQLEVTDYE